MKTRKRVQFQSSKPSRTQQHMMGECDIRTILKKYQQTGHISHLRKGQPLYGDFTKYNDFKTNLDVVREAHDSFSQLPSELRKRFRNDPSYLVDFLANPKNDEEAVKLGLRVKAPEVQLGTNDDKTTITAPVPPTEPNTEKA